MNRTANENSNSRPESFSHRDVRKEGRRSAFCRLWPALSLALLVCSPASARPVHSYIDAQGVVTYFSVPEDHVDIDGKVAPVPEESPAPPVQPPPSIAAQYDASILKHANTYRVDPDLVRAVIRAESNFNYRAVSSKGAVGLMQLIPSTARRFGVINLFHPDQNIEGGVKYLKLLLETFHNDLKLALAAYNAGENAVLRIGGIPNYPETVDYVSKITSSYGPIYRPYEPGSPFLPAEDAPAINKIYRIVDSVRNVIVYTNRPTHP
ncbi:MAG: lytic transglycosylase domain-containing protein [Acidobacteria bacterium]|nr:lytic transglycosylase domain-containing protein [Acidobacteriota bacterium]